MEVSTQIYVILCLVLLLAWKCFFAFKITLVAPIFRNSETRELGGWAKKTMRIPFPPFSGLRIWAGSDNCKVRDVQWYKGDNYFLCDTHYEQPICTTIEQYEHMKKCVVMFGWKFEEVPSGHCLKSWKYDHEL